MEEQFLIVNRNLSDKSIDIVLGNNLHTYSLAMYKICLGEYTSTSSNHFLEKYFEKVEAFLNGQYD